LPSADKTSAEPSRARNRQVAKIEMGYGVSFTVNESNFPLLIGRDPDCDICIPIASVSRRHCELFLDNFQLYLRDTSTNGTLVGSRRLRGESMIINRPTRIHLADSPVVTVTPFSSADQVKRDRTNDPGGSNDRRQVVRRTKNVVVDFERRSPGQRRVAIRRLRDRKSGS
jgi:pSer/pThr/pTyr-binding forkhead associated (FHA) protein